MPKKKYRTTREYLDIATKIVTGQRQYDYGDKYQNHKNISELWSSYLGTKISAHDVAICMLLVKVARIKKIHVKSFVDQRVMTRTILPPG